jgi:hypothetical protein
MALEAMMAKTGSNPVAQVLQHLGDFFEWRDYPEGGVWDRSSGYGYFYHAHPGGGIEGEHGHFHVFWAAEPGARANLAALSMDRFGRLLGAFVPNQWHVALTAEGDWAARYAQFNVDLAFPCYAANSWLSSAVRATAPQLAGLHRAGLKMLEDPAIAADRGRAVLVHHRFDLASILTPPSRPSLKAVKR